MDIKNFLKKMTLDEKLAQISQFNTAFILADSKAALTGPVKDMKLTAENIAELGSTLNFCGAEEMIAAQKKHLEEDPNKIPLLFMMDVIHGFRTIYPIPLGMGAAFDEGLMEKCCAMAAKEAALGGVQVTFGPMIDLVRDARWGRVMESTGEDPYHNSLMARAQVRGFQSGNEKPEYNLAACVKHFAAYGAAEAGRDYNTTDMSEHTLREYYLPGYHAAVDEGVEMLMTAFNLLNGVPTAGNKHLINDILRGEWGFDKLVITDYHSFLEMKSHGYCETDEEVAEVAFGTSTDIEMCSTYFIRFGKKLLEEGKITMERIDESVLRILALKDKLGMFDSPFAVASVEEGERVYLSREHREICREAAEKSAVLLKNDGVLPFGADVKRIAVIGPYAKLGMVGFWSCLGKSEECVTVYEGISGVIGEENVIYSEGCLGDIREEPDMEMIEKAKTAAASADAAVLCLGEHWKMTGEGTASTDISLSPAQKALIRAVSAVNPKTAVVLFNGRPLALGDIIDGAGAFMTMWQPGTEGGNAAANLLFGRCDFTGRLPMSFPYYTGQCPVYYNRMMTGRPKPNEDRYYPYCSNYIDSPNRPLFAFGYGLSYTSFEITRPVLSSDTVTEDGTLIASATVKNVGEREGYALAQLYIRDIKASIVRPIREMKGYQRIALLPGEEKTVEFRITDKDLRFHTASGEFASEAGRFRVWISFDAESGEFAEFTLIK